MSFVKLANTAPPSTPAAGLTELFVSASKVLSQIDDTGKVTAFAAQAGAGAIAQSSPANPSGTTDLTGKMMGLAGTITPVTTGRILLMISGTIFNATAIADGAQVQLRHGTGSAPANGDALTGTAVGGLQKYIAATTAQKAPFAISVIVTGLSLATAHWLDVGLAAITGGTASLTDLSLTALEF